MSTKVSEIKIIPLKPKDDGLVAIATCVIDNKLYCGSIGIYTRMEGGYRVTFPTKKVNEKSINLFHPINKTVYTEIESAIVLHYERMFENYYNEVVE